MSDKEPTMWLVMHPIRKLDVGLFGGDHTVEVPLKTAEGMVGALPLFQSETAAKEYARESGDAAILGVRPVSD